MDTNKTSSITAEVTPNPHTLKFNLGKVLLESGSLNFPDRDKAKGSPEIEKLFDVPSIIGVMVGRDFITLTKSPEANWPDIVPAATEALKKTLASEEKFQASAAPEAPSAGGSNNTEIENKIREILDNEIRPAVAMDGGDIVFYGYHNGTVTLHLQGSCSSCPSSIMTLKMGVENRLKQSVPEVREVVQI